jgi:lipoprotein-anchoring transpeptidase ErfK/SrfK
MNPNSEALLRMNNRFILVDVTSQKLYCYDQDELTNTYVVSTGKNGLGEYLGSGCTPRGWHAIHAVLGLDAPINSVFVSRQRTGEIYSATFAKANPNRDWILTRILQLDGLEPGRNRGGDVDTLSRYIYIHGTSDEAALGTPVSNGCIRMSNRDVIDLSQWVSVGTRVCVQ